MIFEASSSRITALSCKVDQQRSSTGHKFERFWSEGVELAITTCKVTPTKTTLQPVLFVVADRVPGFIYSGWGRSHLKKPDRWQRLSSSRHAKTTPKLHNFWVFLNILETVLANNLNKCFLAACFSRISLNIMRQLCWVSMGRMDSWTSLTWIFVSYGECKLPLSFFQFLQHISHA